ncbi:MAG TPA: hypothetical protein DHV55_08855 [Clostridiaceae bacterium]|nr:hypothetical protein [Clostridiaceae bacterium]
MYFSVGIIFLDWFICQLAQRVKLAIEYELIRQVIKARKEKNITQAELAMKVGTKQSNISRLEY